MTIDLSRALPYFTPTYSADDTAPLRALGSTDAAVTRVFSTTLTVHYMIDEPGALVFVRDRDVAPDRRDALHTRACDNLRAHAARRKLRFERGPTGATIVIKLDNQHEASLLLLDELWDPPTRVADVDGETIAAVPSRNRLVLTGSKTRGGLVELRRTIAQTSDQSLSPEVFVRHDRMWQPFDT
jgi:hypothetical protein